MNNKDIFNKKEKILIAILLMLIILTISLISFVIYNKLILKDTKNKIQNNNNQQEITKYPINFMQSYTNTTLPGSYIDIYFKAVDNNDNLIFGKILENIKVINVKDDKEQDVFEPNINEIRTPAYILYSINKEQEVLLRKVLYIKMQNNYNIELLLMPNTENMSNIITNTNNEINKFIENQIENINTLPYIENLNDGILKIKV